ncbi:MAG: U32 family peptidase [Eubacterium sp.]|nr:U32 family peptidase [Eubacterium sp.]
MAMFRGIDGRKKKPELLSPAGSAEALKAAYAAGADAVYIGGDRFGARAYADNPGQQDLLQCIRLAHRLGKKLYMTVNTLLKDRELEEQLFKWMSPYYCEGLDGVIVQDLGAAHLFREVFPEMELHASTQLFLTGPAGVGLMKEAGFVRVVPARECTLDEVRAIAAAGLDVECFIHGAMCYSYSGECLMSSMIGGRSGNRGRCAGICRLPFSVRETGREPYKNKGDYPLNMKDMCTAAILPELIDAGISSFKIEGRMKKPEYTAGVTSVYRACIDRAWEEPESYRLQDREYKTLLGLFNRDGFNQSYYHSDSGRDMIAVRNLKFAEGRDSADEGIYDALSSRLKEREFLEKLQKPVSGSFTAGPVKGAALTIKAETKNGRITITKKSDQVQEARERPVSEERIRTQLEKTGGSPFRFDRLDLDVEKDSFLPMSVLNHLRRDAFEQLEQEIQEGFRRCVRDSGGFGGSSRKKYAGGHLNVQEQGCEEERKLTVLPETIEQYRSLAGLSGIDLFYLNEKIIRRLEEEQNLPAFGLVLPFVIREKYYRMVEELVRSYGSKAERILVRGPEEAGIVKAAGFADKAILDAGVYTLNSRSEVMWAKLGFPMNTMSWELSFSEMKERENKRTELIVYGRTPMMLSRQCLKKTMDRCTGDGCRLILKDRKGAEFPVFCDCDSCTNTIYNSLPTSFLKEYAAIRHLSCPSVRIQFTDESPEMAAEIVRAFLKAASGEEVRLPFASTGGHFRRPVE